MIFIALLIVQLFVFIGLIYGLKTVLKRHLGTATSHMDQLAQESEAKLAEAKKRLEDAKTHYDEAIKKSKAEGEKLKQQLIDEGLKAKQETLEQARKQSEEIVDRANAAAELTQEELDQKINEASKFLSMNIIRQIFNRRLNEAMNEQWIAHLLESGLDGLNRLNLKAHEGEVEIVSAFALTAAQKKAISHALNEALGKNVPLKEQIDPEMLIGIRITLGSVVVDGSLEFKLKEAIQRGASKQRI